jgi:hypothetical protein
MPRPTGNDAPDPEATNSQPATFDLSQHDALRVSFTDGDGNEIFHVNFDRTTDDKPQITFNSINRKSGRVTASHTFFDLDV